MSFDYFSKRRMQYILEKLKNIFDTKVDKVSGKGLSTEDYTTTEKNKLAGIATGAEVNVQSDWNQTSTTADDYIKNKPTIPAAQVNSDWNASSGVAQILNKPTIPTVNNGTLTVTQNGTSKGTFTANQSGNATIALTDTTYGVVSKTANGLAPQLPNETTTTKFLRQDGSWSVPSYPTVNNGTLTIQKNGTNIQTFTANQSSNATANITVPTKVSELTNDSGYTKNTGTVTSIATGTGLTGGTITGSGTISTYLPRVAKDSKVFPGANKIIWEEYTNGDNYNLPSNAWYHIISMQGTDTKYGTQLALGMTTEAAYYRNYNNGTWGNWRSLINTNTTYSANNGVGLSGTTFYNSGIRDISINGNYLRKNLNGTNTDLTIPYATTSRITSQVSQVGSDAASSAGWYKVVSGTLTGYSNVSLMFAVHNTASFESGILVFDLRCDNGTSLTVKTFNWIVRRGYNTGHFIVNTNGNNWAIYQNITRTQYYRDTWTVIEESSTNDKQASYTLNNSTTKESTAPTATATSVDASYVSNAGIANKLGSSTVGSSRQAIYLNAGTATAGNYTVAHMGNAAKSNMNDIGRLYPSTGMTSLSDPGNNYDNPMSGTTKSTSWHHYWDTSYSDDPNGSNSWVTQMCNKAGTNQWWVRSRSGGTITNGTAWTAPWEHLVVAPQTGQGGTTTPIYIDANGHTQNCSYTIAKSVPSDAKFTDTTYSSKAAASGGTDVSLVTTGEKYTWNNKGNGTVTQVKVGSTAYNPTSGVISLPAYPSDTNTHRPIQMNGTEILGNNTTALNLKAGSNVSLSNSSGTVTIAATDTNTTYSVNVVNNTNASSQIIGKHTYIKNSSNTNICTLDNYYEGQITLSTTSNTSWTCQQIDTSKPMDIYTSIYGMNPIRIDLSPVGVPTFVFPPYTSATTMTIRVYVREY